MISRPGMRARRAVPDFRNRPSVDLASRSEYPADGGAPRHAIAETPSHEMKQVAPNTLVLVEVFRMLFLSIIRSRSRIRILVTRRRHRAFIPTATRGLYALAPLICLVSMPGTGRLDAASPPD